MREALGSGGHRLARRRRAGGSSETRALRRAGAAGHGPGPRVRPHRAGRRLRAARRRADPRPADPQGRPPPRRASSRSRPRGRARSTRAPALSLRLRAGRRGGVPRGLARRARGRGRRRRRGPALGRAAARGRRGRRDRVGRAARAPAAPPRCCAIADALGLARARRRRAARDPRPAPTAAGCARRACCRRRPGPTASRPREPGATRRRSPPPRSTAGSPRSTCSRPTRCATGPTARRGSARCTRAALVVAHASVLTEGVREHADVDLPGRAVTPRRTGPSCIPTAACSGCAPRSRHPGEVRAGWSVIADARARACGLDTRRADRADGVRAAGRGGAVLRGADARGDRRRAACRWPERREAAPAFRRSGRNPAIDREIARTLAPSAAHRKRRISERRPPPPRHLPLDLGLARGRDLARAQYTIARQQAELSPEDAARLGIRSGEPIEVSRQNGAADQRGRGRACATRGPRRATAVLRRTSRPGRCSWPPGSPTDSANALDRPEVEVRKP